MTAIIGDIEDSMLPIKFDLVDIKSVSESMQNEILKDGVVWHQ